ncbi:hypothetical protein SMU21_04651 [Streptococcus mutans 1SM1]|nr:hypothetical protein SMU21_04651 [Streptococcus mutans 1SM1]EMB69460.1 hypothetical protein SMU33_07712 [Streptococcus mutans 11SSST2]EMB79922.1 hypothetical protein SMU50_01266 [Streptococcus mutans 5SM3]EMB90422.1 hypothetical protein SMU57_02119 [Streptococcus mutans NMT4863]EMC44535.1 hypothetical protein SMU97_03266 [Streptococcus mutans SM4]
MNDIYFDDNRHNWNDASVCMRKQVMVLINSYQIETISHQRLNKIKT